MFCVLLFQGNICYALLFQGTLIHLLKVARLLRLAKLMQKLDRYSQYRLEQTFSFLFFFFSQVTLSWVAFHLGFQCKSEQPYLNLVETHTI